MKIVRNILLGIISIIALVLIIALFVSGKYAVEREVQIEKPKAEVFAYVKLLKNQDNYSSWANMDPNMKKEFRGTDGTVGFISAWEGDPELVGSGEQEIEKITEGERIDYELRFMVPFEATDKAYVITESVNDSVTLTKWGFYGEMPYPMNLMLPFMGMEEQLGADLQTGLDKLKEILETAQDIPADSSDVPTEKLSTEE